ncbi:UNVERIFIED_CONTAM: hypothetical protein PYX00_007769 [Menopon gallinae]
MEARSVSEYSTIFSAVPFEWEEKYYEFTDLCDPGSATYIDTSTGAYFEKNSKERYLMFCEKLHISPIVKLYNNLDGTKIDLTFHGISKKQMRAACAALEINTTVEELILKGNRLSPASCSLLSEALARNYTLTYLDMTGCRIGPEGGMYLAQALQANTALRELNLSRCYIGDEGMIKLAEALKDSTSLNKLILSYNSLDVGAAEALAMLLTENEYITDIALDYNYMYDPVVMKKFFKNLAANTGLVSLSLQWNGISDPSLGLAIAQVLKKNETLKSLDLSYNRLDSSSVKPFRRGIAGAKALGVLRMARNPITAEDAENLLLGLKSSKTVKVLDLSEIWVNKEFVKTLKKLQSTKDVEVPYGGIHSNYVIHGPDYQAVLMKRARYEAQKPKPKKQRRDFGHLMFLLGDQPITQDQFMEIVKKFKCKVSKELFSELIKQFPTKKSNLIDVVAMRDKYLSLFPDTTPPEPKKPKKKKEKKEKKKAAVTDRAEINLYN